MKVIVTRYTNYVRPGTPLTFEMFPCLQPQVLPHDVRDYVIAIGAGYAIQHVLGDRSGGVAAFIERKRSQP